jgi:hypothetical protein
MLGFFAILPLSCEKDTAILNDAVTNESTRVQNSNIVIDEHNIGAYHNDLVLYVIESFDSLGSQTNINAALNQPDFIKNMMFEYCNEHNIPIDSNITSPLAMSYEDMLEDSVFSISQKSLLTQAFQAVYAIEASTNLTDLRNDLLNKRSTIQNQSTTTRRKMSVAILNQLIASLDLWLIDDIISKLPDNGGLSDQDGEVLGADAVGMGYALLGGGWTSPLCWAASMFAGAGSSLGKHLEHLGYDTWWYPW